MKKLNTPLLTTIPTALLLFGYAVPALLSKDGAELYQNTEKRYAQTAIEDVESALPSPSFYKLYTTNLRVTSLSPTGDERCPYEAVVQGYTYFHLENKALKWLVKPGCSYQPYDERAV